jgi:hypothetical protein
MNDQDNIIKGTIRVYDSDLTKEVNKLFAKAGGHKNDIWLKLVNAGLKQVKEEYGEKEAPVPSLAPLDAKKIVAMLDEIDGRLDDISAITIAIKDLEEMRHEEEMELSASIYHILLQPQGDKYKEAVEAGLLDTIPARFRKGKAKAK